MLSSVVVPEKPQKDLSNEVKNLFNDVLTGKTEKYNVVIPNKINIPAVKETKPEEPVEKAQRKNFR